MKKQVKLTVAQREALTKESIGIVTLGAAQLKMVAGGMMQSTKRVGQTEGPCAS